MASAEDGPVQFAIGTNGLISSLGFLDHVGDDVISIIADQLMPADTDLQSDLDTLSARQHKYQYALNSVGAARWVQLCKVLATTQAPWRSKLLNYRQRHRETMECARVLEAVEDQRDDWPLEVLRLRGSKWSEAHAELSHATPISRHTLRTAFLACALDVHPDRLQVPQASQAMSILNEAYKQALVHFSDRPAQDVLIVDQLGLNHHA